MTSIPDANFEFSARLQRIEASNRARTQRVFVGEDESYVVPRHTWKPKSSVTGRMLGNFAYPLSLVLSLAFGAAAHGLGMLIRFYVQGLPNWKANPDVEMMVQLLLGIVLAIVLGHLVRLRNRALVSVGAAIGVLFFHNAVHAWPRVFASLTSELWVTQMLAHTKAHSLLWRGISFML
jgi:cytochrome bd-type quinol oxidase subunit 2